MVNGSISLEKFKNDLEEYMYLVNHDKFKFEISTNKDKAVILPAEQYYEMMSIIGSLANISK